jgi:hypothetical protein
MIRLESLDPSSRQRQIISVDLTILCFKTGVNFINGLHTAFALVDPKSVFKRIYFDSVSYNFKYNFADFIPLHIW